MILRRDGLMTSVNILRLYLPNYCKKQFDFKQIINRIMEEKKYNPFADTSALESEIDHLVYQLYGLKEEEIKIVEQS